MCCIADLKWSCELTGESNGITFLVVFNEDKVLFAGSSDLHGINKIMGQTFHVHHFSYGLEFKEFD